MAALHAFESTIVKIKVRKTYISPWDVFSHGVDLKKNWRIYYSETGQNMQMQLGEF